MSELTIFILEARICTARGSYLQGSSARFTTVRRMGVYPARLHVPATTARLTALGPGAPLGEVAVLYLWPSARACFVQGSSALLSAKLRHVENATRPHLLIEKRRTAAPGSPLANLAVLLLVMALGRHMGGTSLCLRALTRRTIVVVLPQHNSVSDVEATATTDVRPLTPLGPTAVNQFRSFARWQVRAKANFLDLTLAVVVVVKGY